MFNCFASEAAARLAPSFSRRRLLAAAAGWSALAVSGPVAALPAAEPEPWSAGAARAATPLLDACRRHPFTKGLADGTLPRPAFLFYIVQNMHYLLGYAESLRALAGRLDEAEGLDADALDRGRRRLLRWARETDDARASMSAVYAEHSGGRRIEDDPGYALAEPATMLYANFEALKARTAHPGVGMAALLPCFWVYDGIGRDFVKAPRAEKNPFAGWIAGYGSPEYAHEVRRALRIADALAVRASDAVRAEMADAFIMSCRLELHLLEAAVSRHRWESL